MIKPINIWIFKQFLLRSGLVSTVENCPNSLNVKGRIVNVALFSTYVDLYKNVNLVK